MSFPGPPQEIFSSKATTDSRFLKWIFPFFSHPLHSDPLLQPIPTGTLVTSTSWFSEGQAPYSVPLTVVWKLLTDTKHLWGGKVSKGPELLSRCHWSHYASFWPETLAWLWDTKWEVLCVTPEFLKKRDGRGRGRKYNHHVGWFRFYKQDGRVASTPLCWSYITCKLCRADLWCYRSRWSILRVCGSQSLQLWGVG